GGAVGRPLRQVGKAVGLRVFPVSGGHDGPVGPAPGAGLGKAVGHNRVAGPGAGEVGDEVFELRVAPLPVEPADAIVLAIGVVVALLAAAELVAGGEHDRTGRGEEGFEQGALVGAAASEDLGVTGRALPA